MKNLRKHAATLVLAAGCLVGIGAHAKSLLITAGYYQVNAAGNRANNTVLSSTAPEDNCNAGTPNCVAEYDASGTRVSAITPGLFHN
ncbi:MAG: hypothetical protein ABIN91_04945 [Mucilaginibacter sp.]|uniref:hypothetical protein n=1 Tax=Mucilaginibacter sp. TaxID=1882438 RepID=UPI0032677E1C